jgi:hypothetical protein
MSSMTGERGGRGKAWGASLGALGLLLAKSADNCASVGGRSARVAGEGAALVGKGAGAEVAAARGAKLGAAADVVGARPAALGVVADEAGAARRAGRGLADEAGLGASARGADEIGAARVGGLVEGAGRQGTIEERLLEEVPGLAMDVASPLLDGGADDDPRAAPAVATGRAVPAGRLPFTLLGRPVALPLGRGAAAPSGPDDPFPRVLAPPSSPDGVLDGVSRSPSGAPFTAVARRASADSERWRLAGGAEFDGGAFFRQCDRNDLLCVALVCEHDAAAACEAAALDAWRSAAPLAVAIAPADVDAELTHFVGALLRARAARPELAGLGLVRLTRDAEGRARLVNVTPKAPPRAPRAPAAPKRP